MNKNTKKQNETEEREPRRLEGVILSSKMDKTVVVELEQTKKHPLYKKRYARHGKIKAHDPENKYKEGERVELVETKPYSKNKAFRVVQKVKKD